MRQYLLQRIVQLSRNGVIAYGPGRVQIGGGWVRCVFGVSRGEQSITFTVKGTNDTGRVLSYDATTPWPVQDKAGKYLFSIFPPEAGQLANGDTIQQTTDVP